MLAALQRLLCSVLILVITAGFARASALICSTLSMYFKIWSDACLSPPPSTPCKFGGKRFPTPPLLQRQNHTCYAENRDDLTAGHFAHFLVETACSYDYTSQSSLPRLQTHLLLLQHLKTTLTTASNLHHSLLFPSSSPAGMRSLSFMVASLFVSALTLSSASTQIHSYIFKLKKLPDPLTPLFAAVTTITANEDLSLVYEFKRFSESSFGLQLSPLNLRCRSCRIPAFLHC
ncbi:hypothetical protein D6D21_10694 [Aureobasidium pullulans]|uniref:Uncharacterized protein n=1 Tax=Aureobasidium pullulans TaxID=5580 RepID=A0AB74IH12_AURPU|nr:hypothetical protein D6D21_10694 [Aureobasidium pullulans]